MVTAFIWIGIALLVFVRQFLPHALTNRTLILAPAVLAFFGLRGLDTLNSTQAVAFFALSAAVAVVFGIWRGTTFRVSARNNQTWVQATSVTLLLWVGSIAARVVLMGLGHVADLAGAGTAAELPLLLAITFAAQNATLWMRASQRSLTLA